MHKWKLPIILLAISAIACNLISSGPDTSATVQALYGTVTARAMGTIGPPTETPTPQPTEVGAPTETPGPTTTPTFTPTPPNERTNGPAIEIPLCQLSIDVDGNGPDWNDQPIDNFALDETTFGAGNWNSSSDLSGIFEMCWTRDALYLIVLVEDDVFAQTQTGTSTQWQGDEIEFLFDGDLRGDFYRTTWDRTDDIQLGLSPGNFTDTGPTAVRYYPSFEQAPAVDVASLRNVAQYAYTVEARIPWTVLNITPSTEQNYGICIAISDNDNTSTASQDSMVSHCPDLSVPNPATWATFMLLP